MPILVHCPECSAGLSVPDHAASKYTRCPLPSCGTLIPIPQAVVDAELVPEVRRPKPRPTPVDYGEEPEPPRRKRRREDRTVAKPPRRRRKHVGSGVGPALAIIGVILFGLALVRGVGYGVYALVGKKSGSDLAKPTKPPSGWREYSYPDEGFKAHFPKEPSVKREQAPPGAVQVGPLVGVTGLSQIKAGDTDDSVRAMVIVGRLQPGLSQSERDRLVGELLRLGQAEFRRGSQSRTVSWHGQQVREVIGDEGVLRCCATESAVYLAGISARGSGQTDVRARPEDEKAFFENFQLLR